jgi:orotate phosphoribosyltransferase
VYAEQDTDRRVLKRGFALARGERVLLCDDILTTGRSVREVIALAEHHEAEIIAIALLLDRSGGEVKFEYDLHALAQVAATSYEPAECPFCREGRPLTQRGSRKGLA